MRSGGLAEEGGRYTGLSLAFTDADLERQYREEEASAALHQLRQGIRSSFPIWLIALAVAYFSTWPGRESAMLLIGFGLVPVLVTALLVLRRRHDFQWQQVVGGFVNFVPGLANYQLMIYAGQQEEAGLYVTLLASLFAFFLQRTRFITAVSVVSVYTAIALARHWVIRGVEERVFDTILVVVAVGASASAAWYLERARRNAYHEKAQLDVAHAELKATQAELVQAKKMASLGTLVAGVAHDINTPLGAIAGTQQTLTKVIDKLQGELDAHHSAASESRKVTRMLKALSQASTTIGDGAKRVDEVVTRLRSFARLDEASLQDVSVADCVGDVLSMVDHRRPPGVTLRSELSELPKLRCAPADFNQLIMILLTNALEAVGDEGRVSVRGTCSDDQLTLVVEDDGAGITTEHLERVFDPGFTTKGVGVGGGYGLAIAYRIANRHGGSIAIDSEVGGGTVVSVHLPLGGPPPPPDGVAE